MLFYGVAMPANIEIYLILKEKNHFMKIICLKTSFFVKSIPFEESKTNAGFLTSFGRNPKVKNFGRSFLILNFRVGLLAISLFF